MNDFDKRKLDKISQDKLFTYTLWLIERWEKFNEELDILSVYLIGFLALEIALIGQIGSEKMGNMKFSFALALISLIVSIILYFKILQSAKFGLHGKQDLLRQIDRFKGGERLDIVDFILASDPEKDIFGSYEKEIDDTNIFYPWAIRFAIAGQIFLAVSIIGAWYKLDLALLFT